MTKTITFTQDELAAIQAIFDAALKGSGMSVLNHVAFLSHKIINTPADPVQLPGIAQPIEPKKDA